MILIEQYPNALSPDLCEYIIQQFNQHTDKQREGTLGLNVVNKDIKQSTDLYINQWSPDDQDWMDIQTVFHDCLQYYFPQYINTINEQYGQGISPFVTANIMDTGYQIQQTKPGEFYSWHNDNNIVEYFINNHDVHRHLTYIWYLNTIPEEEDGYTEFLDGTRIQPEVGKLIFFPSTWTYYHRGVAPKNITKYIATGWLCNYR